jgi:DNA-binding NarL/FixJ family response regulator
VIIEDEESFRAGLRLLLDHQPGIKVVGEAEDGPAAIRLAAPISADVVVVDLMLPGMDGFDVIRRLRAEGQPPPQVVAISASAGASTVAAATEAGAAAFVSKVRVSQELAATIHRVSHHGIQSTTGGAESSDGSSGSAAFGGLR